MSENETTLPEVGRKRKNNRKDWTENIRNIKRNKVRVFVFVYLLLYFMIDFLYYSIVSLI